MGKRILLSTLLTLTLAVLPFFPPPYHVFKYTHDEGSFVIYVKDRNPDFSREEAKQSLETDFLPRLRQEYKGLVAASQP